MNYKKYGKKQKLNIPSFSTMQTIFDIDKIIEVNSNEPEEQEPPSFDDVSHLL